jgi:hypothetical protein
MLAAALRQLLLPPTQLGLAAALQQQVLPSTLLLLPQAAGLSLPWPAQQQQSCLISTSAAAAAAKAAARAPPSRHERNVANLQFQRKRAEWRRQLKELRKQWWQEHRQVSGLLLSAFRWY